MKNINRRKFIAGTSALTAFTILKPATVFGTTANSAVRLGIIGCGNRGTAVISDMVNHTGARIYAMADLLGYQLENAQPRFNELNLKNGGAKIDTSKIFRGSRAYLELVNDPNVDAVLVSSPACTHPGFLEAAVGAGKHVYCEKPVAPDVPGCKQVIRAGQKAEGKVSVAIGFQICHATPYIQMAERIRRGDIGEVVNVQLYYISSGTGNLINEAHSDATSTLSAILGRMSATSKEEITWDEMYYSNQKYDLNMNLKQFDNF